MKFKKSLFNAFLLGPLGAFSSSVFTVINELLSELVVCKKGRFSPFQRRGKARGPSNSFLLDCIFQCQCGFKKKKPCQSNRLRFS